MLAATIALGVVVVVGSSAHGVVDPVAMCKQKKGKATGKKATDLLKAFGKNMRRPDSARLNVDVSKARSKFTKAFTKAESGTCQTTGDVGTIETKVDAFVAEIRDDLSGFVDNGDGTVTDNRTGLMWEKKSSDGSIHDVENYYSWAGCCDGVCSSPWEDSLCQPNAAAAAACSTQTSGAVGCSECTVGTCDVDPYGWGAITTIWDWLVQVNAEGGSGFAGHSDWRLPSEAGCNACWTGFTDYTCPCDPRELETLLLSPYPCGGVLPCIDPIFGLTGLYNYWSSTTYADDPSFAWFVNFGGAVSFGSKFMGYDGRGRAVRDGSPSAAFLDVTSGILD